MFKKCSVCQADLLIPHSYCGCKTYYCHEHSQETADNCSICEQPVRFSLIGLPLVLSVRDSVKFLPFAILFSVLWVVLLWKMVSSSTFWQWGLSVIEWFGYMFGFSSVLMVSFYSSLATIRFKRSSSESGGICTDIVPVMFYTPLFLGFSSGLLLLIYAYGLLFGTYFSKEVFVSGTYGFFGVLIVLMFVYIVIKLVWCHSHCLKVRKVARFFFLFFFFFFFSSLDDWPSRKCPKILIL